MVIDQRARLTPRGMRAEEQKSAEDEWSHGTTKVRRVVADDNPVPAEPIIVEGVRARRSDSC